MTSPALSRASWLRRPTVLLATVWFVVVPLVAGALFTFGYPYFLPGAGWVAIGAFWLLTLGWHWRRRPPSPGPFFYYDLIRGSRRGEPVAHRLLYALLLAGLLLLSYWSWFPEFDLTDPLRSLSLPRPGDRARFAATFFGGFMGLQFLIVTLFTPLYVAGAIADERERRTLEFLFITDLSDREIVLGVLGSRLARLLLLVLTGLPVLCLLPLLGGVDPLFVLTGYAATIFLMLSLGGVGILMSVQMKTTLGAVAGTYVALPLLLVVALCPYPVAHPVWTALLPSVAADAAQDPAGVGIGLLIFCAVQGVIAAGCCGAAIVQLRGSTPAVHDRPRAATPVEVRGRSLPANKEIPDAPDYGPDLDAPYKPRPPVGRDALLWKEMYVEKYFGSINLELRPRDLWVAVVLLPVLAGVGWLVNLATDGTAGELLQPLVRVLSVLVGGLLLMLIGLSAASRISREREMRTLDPLFALPVSIWDILFAKWLGSLLSVRGPVLGLAPIWALGLAVGGVNVCGVLLLIAGWLICAAFLASLGLWLSAMCRITLRATLLTLLITLLFVVSPLGLLGDGLYNATTGGGGWTDAFTEHLLNPGVALRTFGFRTADLQAKERGAETWTRVTAAMAALYVYLLAVPALWALTLARLRADKGSPAGRDLAAPG